MLLSSIPSPGRSVIELGPLDLRAYGLMIAFGVLAAVWLAQKRWSAVGGGPDDVSAIAMWAVPAGLVGARLYHVATDWRSFEGRWGDVIKIWEGGLGIPGGMALGLAVGLWVVQDRGWDRSKLLDAVVPALPLAQAIGRWGNWFNQELFGKPTDLPWAIEVDPNVAVIPTEYSGQVLFHPTFLYESLWNFALVAVLLWVGKKQLLRPGRLIYAYLLGYGVGRLWIEALRIDTASRVFGQRINIWIMSIVILAGIVGIVTGRQTGGGGELDDAGAGPDDDGADEDTEEDSGLAEFAEDGS
jgi:prolipoprotein diacylglyceryl transferase